MPLPASLVQPRPRKLPGFGGALRCLLLTGVAWLCLGPSTARAEGPELVKITLGGDGTLKARMALPYPISKVRQVLQDPVACSRLAPDVVSVQASRRGNCEVVTTTTKGVIGPMEYRSLRCPTAQGWQESLLTSSDFTEYQSEWHLVPSASGTEVEFRVKVDLSLAIPRALVNAGMKKSVKSTMNRLQEAVAAR